jgi:hypothetical protein
MNKVTSIPFKLPRKRPYPKKPITLQVDVAAGEMLTTKSRKEFIHRTTELVGIAPFNWQFCPDCGQEFLVLFGFDIMELAILARSRLEASGFNVLLWSVDEEEKRAEANSLGKMIDAYMRVRAEEEGVGYELTPKFFEERIVAGVGKFVGVTFAEGKLLGDDEQPAFFAKWNRKH